MPIILKPDELEPGMVLSGNIMNRYTILLRASRVLTDKDIISLQRQLPDIQVQIVDPVLDQIVDFKDTTQDYAISRKVRTNIASATSKVSDSIRNSVTLSSDNVAGMQHVINDMLEFVQSNPVTAAIVEQSSDWSEYLQEHSSNVFYLSVITGNTIKNYIKRERERLSIAKQINQVMDITPLATAALLHDIGMVPIEYLYGKEETLTDEELEKIRRHPIAGEEMLPDHINPMVKQIIRTHHENQNGSGYPGQIAGDRINVFARIVRIADTFSAATSSTAYHKPMSPVLVLHEMLYGQIRHFYDPIIMKVFSTIVQPFPIGAKIKLKDNKCGVVVGYNIKNAFDPKMIIAFDEFGDPMPEKSLQRPFFLSDRSDVQINSYDGDDISFINDLPDDDDLPECSQDSEESLLHLFNCIPT